MTKNMQISVILLMTIVAAALMMSSDVTAQSDEKARLLNSFFGGFSTGKANKETWKGISISLGTLH
jgi:hypothetical protein